MTKLTTEFKDCSISW